MGSVVVVVVGMVRPCQIFLQALDLLQKRHGEVVRETYQSGVVKKWSHDTHSHGAFVMHGVMQRYQYLVGHIIFTRGSPFIIL